MDAVSRIERTLANAVALAQGPGCPPSLARAMQHAVFPKGARVRPRLCLAVAGACGDDAPALSEAAAAAIELLHCASLVHDDLPCFDDAATRRGRPSVHRAHGEPLAVLAGDALIVLSFQILARAAPAAPARLGPLLLTIGDSVGVPRGIVAGQGWESEPRCDLAEYQREKTGSLFAAATAAGAAAAGADAETWRLLGDRLGEAYQVADDLRDAVEDEAEMGKPAGQDAAHARPSAVLQFGLSGAIARLEDLAAEAVASIPPCLGAEALRSVILSETRRLLPRKLAVSAA
ncbi:polyprenyl synthetase family protein [Paracraurococcus ruber]|uniref:Geranylgeranyl pyrophosphate synthase n=1 Tax=Paracraurococcus ruber TaxID=77675 RepID=A0ABS1CXS7_9PROT|nr:polyprenyl synthetase family protein [Paracraurococcus ruber]MBK1659203.1 geranylgeranyl pyrophosphate synthase [Paracraurococcus ruber]TDG30633.1 polyprenyl synthetase family protein [Paracraurococcus ruber]